MKRYASHFLLLPGHGWLKQHVLEMDGSSVVRIFPLSMEVENTEWLPGVLVLLDCSSGFDIPSDSDTPSGSDIQDLPVGNLFPAHGHLPFLQAVPGEWGSRMASFVPYHLYPFDFTTMRPVAGTRHRLLR